MTKKKKSVEFPTSDAKFDAAFKQLMANLAATDPESSAPAVVTWTRLGLDAASEYDPLVALLGTPTTAGSWEFVYPLEKAKATHTDPLKLRKNTIKEDALVIIHSVRLILKAKAKTNPAFLTSNDKTVWYIPQPNPITPSFEAAKTAHPVPLLTIHEIKNMQHTVDAHNPESPKSIGLPEGMYFIWLLRYIGTTAPTDTSQYTTLSFSGKFRNTSNFIMANQKQTAWYIAAYISTTGVIGNFSASINANIA